MKNNVSVIILAMVWLPNFWLNAQPSGTIIHVPTPEEMRAGATIQPQTQFGNIQAGGLWVVNGKFYNPQSSFLFRNIVADVNKVYEDGVLLNWTEKRPIYGRQAQSDSLVNEGNFLGGVPVSHDRPIIGYDTVFSKDILVLNLGRNVAEGEKISFRAMQVGTTNFDGRTIELWDCGKPYVPPPPTPEQIAARKQAAEDAKLKADAAKKLADERVLKFNQDAAAKGDSYGLLRMGERYRDGDGVEKDLAKAREYFQKAIDAGSPTAAEELSNLK